MHVHVKLLDILSIYLTLFDYLNLKTYSWGYYNFIIGRESCDLNGIAVPGL